METKEKIQLTATCLFGLEAILAGELKKLGYDDQLVENGRVTFSGDIQAVCRSNLWLRTAERVLLKMGEFQALTFEELFEGTKKIKWSRWIPADGKFPVEVSSIRSRLASVPDCQSIIKKAIVESMKGTYGGNWFDESGPEYKIHAMLLNDWVTLSIDTSGTSLHKRGYRNLAAAAPLRETLAAGMILISRWNRDRVLIDPFCGSGTIPVEAALIGNNIAPGINRSFISKGWSNIDKQLWTRAREEARDKIEAQYPLRIQGTDIDNDVLSLARYHAKKAGVAGDIHFQRMDMADISSRYEYGFIICNPPYGERLGAKHEAEKLYVKMGRSFDRFKTWSFYIITSHEGFEKLFGRKADKKRKLYNGNIKCYYYQFFGPKPAPANTIAGRHDA